MEIDMLHFAKIQTNKLPEFAKIQTNKLQGYDRGGLYRRKFYDIIVMIRSPYLKLMRP